MSEENAIKLRRLLDETTSQEIEYLRVENQALRNALMKAEAALLSTQSVVAE